MRVLSIKSSPVSVAFGCLTSLLSSSLMAEMQTLNVKGKSVTADVIDGYEIELVSTDLNAPRMLSFNNQGDLFIGSQSGNVYTLSPPYDAKPQALIPRFKYPHSVAFRNHDIFIASTEGLYRASGVKDTKLQNVQRIAELPSGGGHSSRSVKVGPDDRIYVSLGISGNCSNEYIGSGYSFDKRRGGVMRLDEASGQWIPFATGLRNPVDFAWNDQGQVFAANNGPDHLGFEQPKEQFTELTQDSFHGMPWFQVMDGTVVRDECRPNLPPKTADQVVKPMAEFPARSAPMGVAFIQSDSATFPEWAGDAVVALHGSWAIKPGSGVESRRSPAIMKISFDEKDLGKVETLVSGFQNENGDRWSRPTGVAVGPDGYIYFASDGSDSALYRLKPKG